MFNVDLENMAITMHRGDTGSFKVHASRKSGESWTANDRMLMTIKSANGDIVIQRLYRLGDQYDLGDGVVLIEFHNDDTDSLENGQYGVELRFDISPIWDGTPPTGRCVNALTAGVRMVEGAIVRTVIQTTLEINDIYGEV
jgi:hypothetical protein